MPKESRAFLGAIALFLACALWVFFGAPLSANEWRGIPSQFQMGFSLLPLRLTRVLKLFHSQEKTPALITLYDAAENRLVSLPMEEYLIGAIAMEMPASYHMEALKAQAVASRTRLGMGCPNHTEAMACSDPAHCQGYLNPAGQAAKWGSEYGMYRARIEKAVRETADQIITYNGKPITVLFHAVSGGHTEDAREVFGEDVPYLRGVESSGEEGTSRFETTQTFTLQSIVALLNAAFPNAHLSAEWLPLQILPLTYSDSGRVTSLTLGDITVSGRELRQALDLNSTCFSIQFTDSSATFTQKGYGHGVGMSQAGANAMAAKGADYEAILRHYYQGTELSDWNESTFLGETENEVPAKEETDDIQAAHEKMAGRGSRL